MGIEIGNSIINGGEVPKMSSGAALPATGVNNEVFLNTATSVVYVWQSGAWSAYGGSSAGGVTATPSALTSGKIPKATGAANIQDSNLTEDVISPIPVITCPSSTGFWESP